MLIGKVQNFYKSTDQVAIAKCTLSAYNHDTCMYGQFTLHVVETDINEALGREGNHGH